ncbi:MAG: biotin/lipoyl-binding protein [Gemmatimonadales bacterium]|nr:MAG: biotin/lipoyl-binding protein [Gemmatimonadales bacterium]
MDFFVHMAGQRLEVKVKNGQCWVDGSPMEVELAPPTGTPVRSARVGGRSLRVRPTLNGRGHWRLQVEGRVHDAEVLDPGQEFIRQARKAAGVGVGVPPLKAPMPGLVVRVEVEEGQEVQAGDSLIIVEAMKMENELRASAPGVVTRIVAEVGAAVEKDAVLMEFDPLPSDDGEEAEG